MKRIERINILEGIKEIENKNLIKVIDFSTYQNLLNEEYLEIDKRFGSKLYRDIGLRSYNYLRVTNEIDSRIATNLIITRINKSRFKFFIKDNNLIILSKEFRNNLDKLEENLSRLEYPDKYEFRDKRNSKISYLIKNERFGIYIEIDIIEEVIEIFRLELIEDYFLIDKYSEGEMIIEDIGLISLSGFYKDMDKRRYSYEELERLRRDFGLENEERIKGELEKIRDMNEFKRRVEFSNYKVIDLYRWILKNLDKIEGFISRVYKEVEEERLAFDLMR